ncbi:MAG: UDP-2,3-diacylglucosamine diphosphatase LpxI [Candidatus Omnitrophica bacterium]|nr:UDP-2,3-diacylglucosamine diphosphatase LpxI [Candidatus Omnitrophota bacterium]
MKTIGIIAGNGRFPLLAAKEARREGYQVAVCGIEKEADPALEKMADEFTWVKLGELKKLVKFFRAHTVHEALMAGKVEKVRIFQGNVRPDLEMIKVMAQLRDRKDDTLLGAVANYLHSEGIDLLDSTLFLKNALPGEGILGKRKPSPGVMRDIHFGFLVAKSIAGADIGQTVVVKNRAVMAVEAIEGTDRTIRRGGELGGGKVVVVKVAKPGQDMRFDIPAVGLGTLKELIEVKAEALGFEAGKTIFLDQEEFVQKANRKGIALVGVKA